MHHLKFSRIVLPYPMSQNKERPSRRLLPEDPYATHLSYHQRRCKVCNHPDCDAIDEEFLNWRSPAVIAWQYKIRDRASIYRHAHATGLFTLRRSSYRTALENLIERNEEAEVTASSFISAVRACTCINNDGQWVEPPRRTIVTHIDGSSDVSSSTTPVQAAEKPYLTNDSGPKIPVAASSASSQHALKLKRSQLTENTGPDPFQIATKIELLEKLLK